MTDTDSDLGVRNLVELTEAELDALGTLRVSEAQEVLGKSFQESLDDWQKGPPDQVLGLCFLFHNLPVGMTLFKRPPPMPSQVSPATASIHGLKIGTPWQGRGWGHKAMKLAVSSLKQGWPSIRLLRLAVDADNHAALAVYRGFGMADSGPVFEGRRGREHHMEVSLWPSGPEPSRA